MNALRGRFGNSIFMMHSGDVASIKLALAHGADDFIFSIQELARFAKRDFKNVYQDIKILTEFGLIQLVEGGPRKAAAPVAKFSELVLAA